MLSEIRTALRSLRRTPAFTATVVGILALGIGGSTAVFSVVNQVLLRPLPYAAPGQLVRLYQERAEEPGENIYVSGFAYRGYTEQLSALEDVAAAYTYRESGADLTGEGGAERLRLLPVTANYFDVLRAAPLLGRSFTAEEQTAAGAVVVLSHELWRSHFGADAGVLGQSVRLSGEPYTVVGVARPALQDPVVGAVDMWLPLEPYEGMHPQNHKLTVVGRLRGGATVEQARAELMALDRSLAELDPRGADRPSKLVGLHEDTVGGAQQMLYVLLGAVGLVLLIVCVNIANLLLARSTTRQREFAVRAALGAGRGRIVTQLLLESVMLGLAGGVAGTLLGLFLLDGIIALGSSSVPRLDEASFDGRVLAFGMIVSLLAALVFGLLPAVRFSRIAVSGVLRDTSRSVTSDRARNALRSLLVGAQMAIAFMLLVGASILTLSLYRLGNVDLGFLESDVVTFEVHLPSIRYDAQRRARFYEDLAARLTAMPGVNAAGGVSRLPGTGEYHSWGSRAATGPLAGVGGESPSQQRVVSGRYFEAAGIELVAGRLFDGRDDATVPRRAVISRTVAEQSFPGIDPIGQRIRVLGSELEVIGVVTDVAMTPEGEQRPTVYHAHRQFADNRNWGLIQVVHAGMEPERVVGAARDVLQSMDPELVLHRPAPLAEVVGRGVAQRRFTTWLMSAFAALAVLLATTGLFGVIAYVVRQRRREMGIRAALGARPRQIRGMVVSEGLRVALAGIAVGLVGAVALSRVISALVFETSPADPLVLAAASLTMALVAAGAAYLPAREATRVDPRVALTEE